MPQFEKGDSNRCRNAYEKILHAQLPTSVLNAQKKNKHISVGRCLHLAIVHRVALPPYEELQEVGFETDDVPEHLWSVPTDCKRFEKKVFEEGFCYGNRCDTCARLYPAEEDSETQSTASLASYRATCHPVGTSPATSSPRAAARTLSSVSSMDGVTSAADMAAALEVEDLLMAESTRLVHRVLEAEGMLPPLHHRRCTTTGGGAGGGGEGGDRLLAGGEGGLDGLLVATGAAADGDDAAALGMPMMTDLEAEAYFGSSSHIEVDLACLGFAHVHAAAAAGGGGGGF